MYNHNQSHSHNIYSQTLTGGFRIQCARMASFLHLQDALDPCDDLVRARIRRLVQIDVARLDVLLDVTIERRRTARQRRVVIGANVQLVEVLQQQRPLRGVQLADLVRRLDLEVAGLLDLAEIIDGLLFDLFRLLRRLVLGARRIHV